MQLRQPEASQSKWFWKHLKPDLDGNYHGNKIWPKVVKIDLNSKPFLSLIYIDLYSKKHSHQSSTQSVSNNSHALTLVTASWHASSLVFSSFWMGFSSDRKTFFSASDLNGSTQLSAARWQMWVVFQKLKCQRFIANWIAGYYLYIYIC